MRRNGDNRLFDLDAFEALFRPTPAAVFGRRTEDGPPTREDVLFGWRGIRIERAPVTPAEGD